MFTYNHSLTQMCLMIETVSQVSDVALWLFVCLQNCKNYYTPIIQQITRNNVESMVLSLYVKIKQQKNTNV